MTLPAPPRARRDAPADDVEMDEEEADVVGLGKGAEVACNKIACMKADRRFLLCESSFFALLSCWTLQRDCVVIVASARG